jgi:hypothetical protein
MVKGTNTDFQFRMMCSHERSDWRGTRRSVTDAMDRVCDRGAYILYSIRYTTTPVTLT